MKKRVDPLAERCLAIVGPELKGQEDDAINDALKALVSDEGLSGDKAVQLWQKVEAARELQDRLTKMVRRGVYQDAKKAKDKNA